MSEEIRCQVKTYTIEKDNSACFHISQVFPGIDE